MSGAGTKNKNDDTAELRSVAPAAESATESSIGSFGGDNSRAASESKSALRNFLTNPILHLLLIITLCMLCFGRTLSSFFLADDIGEVRYICQIFDGHWNLFWSNFTGNYMQVPNMAVYRPMLLLSLVVDYFFWRGNAVGYYISNLLFFSGSACLLYVFLRQLTHDWNKGRSSIAAIFAAALFAASPLHCESISWIVGRVDSLCCFFYLSALASFMQGRISPTARRPICTVAGVVFFWLAICTKEMAIGLAPVLAAIAFIWPDAGSNLTVNENNESPSLKKRLLSAWKFSRPIWISTAAYFVVRLLALGTLLGGYGGSVGASQSASALTKWMDPDSWRRLFLPFSSTVFSAGNPYEPALFCTYAVLVGLVFVRALAGSLPWKFIAFLAIWALTQLAPIYRLFGIGANLEGARFCFFFSLSFSSLLPILLFAPASKQIPEKLALRLSLMAGIALTIATVVLAKAAYASNLVWIHAGKEVRAVLNDAIRLSNNSSKSKYIVLGIPKEHGGAHMILNGSTFEMLLNEPFADRDYSKPFLTFDPMLFGDDSNIDETRLKAELRKADVKGPFVWHSEKKTFEEVLLKPQVSNGGGDVVSIQLGSGNVTRDLENKSRQDAGAPSADAPEEARSTTESVSPYVLGHARYSTTSSALHIANPNNKDGILLTNLSIDPLKTAFVRVYFSVPPSRDAINNTHGKKALPFELRWNGTERASSGASALGAPAASRLLGKASSAWRDEDRAEALSAESGENGKLQSVVIPVGRKWRWYTQSEHQQLALIVPAVEEISISRIELLAAKSLVPSLQTSGAEQANTGAIVLNKPVSISVEAPTSSTNSSPMFEIQVSKNNHFFENFNSANESTAIARSLQLTAQKPVFTLRPEDLQGAGYYQVRARLLGGEGYFSDPLTLWSDR